MTILGSEFLFILLLLNTCLAYAVYPTAMLGRLSVAPVAFMAIGAYAGAYAVEHGHSIWVGAIGGVMVSQAIALILNAVIGHLRGHFYVAATLGLVFIVQQLAFGLTSLTNGYLGVSEPAGLVSTVHVLIVVGACILGAFALSRSFHDSVWRSVGDDDVVAAALGISVRRQILVAGSVSAFIASIVGTLYGNLIAFFDPNTFGFILVLYLIIAVVTGGSAAWYGPIIGGAIMTLLPEVLRVLGPFRESALGVLLALCVIFLPRGLSDKHSLGQGVDRLGARIRRLVSRPKPARTGKTNFKVSIERDDEHG